MTHCEYLEMILVEYREKKKQARSEMDIINFYFWKGACYALEMVISNLKGAIK
jgi:hypothetical protein